MNFSFHAQRFRKYEQELWELCDSAVLKHSAFIHQDLQSLDFVYCYDIRLLLLSAQPTNNKLCLRAFLKFFAKCYKYWELLGNVGKCKENDT